MPEANGTLRQLWLSYHSSVMSTSLMDQYFSWVTGNIVISPSTNCGCTPPTLKTWGKGVGVRGKF